MSGTDDRQVSSPDFSGSYDELLRRYQDLQLRVTRFSAVEQQMINIRNRLDHEIAMHKRMHDSSKKALLEMPDDVFARFIAESVVDIFEVETGLAIISYTDEAGFTHAGIEGTIIGETDPMVLRNALVDLCEVHTGRSILQMESPQAVPLRKIIPLHQAYGIAMNDQRNHISLVIAGGILDTGVQIYEPLDKERDIIFSVFAQQVLAQVVNRKKNKTIVGQVEKIERSQQRMAMITQGFLSFGTSPKENIDLLTRLCGEILKADFAVYFRKGQPHAPCVAGCESLPEKASGKSCDLCFHLLRDISDDSFILHNGKELEVHKTAHSCEFGEMQSLFGCAVLLESSPVGWLAMISAREYFPDENDRQVMKIISAGIAVEELRSISVDKLLKHEQLLASVVQTQQEMICRFLPDTTLTFVNKPFCIAFNQAESQLLGKKVLDLIPGAYRSDLTGTLSQVSPEHPTRSYIHHTTRAGGEEIWQEWTETAIYDKQNRIIEFQSIGRDITESKHAEKERIARVVAENSNRAKSMFVANMSHEIRTPLNAILGYADILEAALTDREQKDYITSIKTSSKSLLTIVNDILDLSKIEAGKIELQYDVVSTVSFFSQFQRIFGPRLSEKHLSYLLDLEPSVSPGIMVDEVRLLQVVSNLLGNSVKFTNHGYIRLRVRMEDRRVINNAGDKPTCAADLVIEVADTGIGIPEHLRETVFDEFTQAEDRKTQGTGLGLAITRRLVNLMGGTIGFASELNKGSVFTVRIPSVPCYDDVEHKPALESLGPENILFEPATVLVVDDIEVNRNFLRDALKNSNLRVIMASGGMQALKMSRKEKPALIITDTRLPRMDGFRLLQRIKKEKFLKATPVIAYTAAAMKTNRMEILESDFAGLLIKPVLVSDLYRELCRHLPYRLREPSVSDVAVEWADEQGTITHLDELISVLETDCLARYEIFTKRQPIAAIRDFGVDLTALGNRHNALVLARYGEEMQNAADHFNIERILVLVDRFPELIRQLKGMKTQ